MKRIVLIAAAAVMFGLVPLTRQRSRRSAARLSSDARAPPARRLPRLWPHSSESEIEVEFETASGGKLTARRDQIVSLRRVEGRVVDGEFQPLDPNNTRLFFDRLAVRSPRDRLRRWFITFAVRCRWDSPIASRRRWHPTSL